MAPALAAVGGDGRTYATTEAVALLHQAQAGDRDAFADLFLLTELPSAVPCPSDPVADRDFAGVMAHSSLPRPGSRMWSHRANRGRELWRDEWKAIGFGMSRY